MGVQSVLKLLPVRIGVTVDAAHCRGGAGVASNIECLVTVTHLLPLRPPIALHDPRDQLLSRELFEYSSPYGGKWQ